MKKALLVVFVFIILLLSGFLVYWNYKEISTLKMPDTYENIIKRGYLIAGVKTDTKPFGYIEDGEIKGFDIDLAKTIAEYLLHDASKLQLVSVTPADRLIKLTTGEVDLVIATMTVTPQRQNIIDFSHSYFIAGQAVMTLAGSKITALSDLAYKNVGVIFGTTAEKNLRVLLPSAKIFGYKTYQDAYEALKSGTIDAITADDTILRNYTLNDKQVKVLAKRYSKEPYAIGIRKGSENKILLEKVNYVLKSIITNNSINHMYAEWGLD